MGTNLGKNPITWDFFRNLGKKFFCKGKNPSSKEKILSQKEKTVENISYIIYIINNIINIIIINLLASPINFNQESNMILYPIFMNTLAYRLERKGFKVIKIAPNKKKPQYNVYFFEDTLELHDAIHELLDNQ